MIIEGRPMLVSMRKLFLIAVNLLVVSFPARSTENPIAPATCGEDEAHILLKLVASGVAGEAGWTLVGRNGVDIIMGQQVGAYDKLAKPTPYAHSTCIRRSECDGGGSLTLTVTGQGAFDSQALFVDGAEIMSVVGQSVASMNVRCDGPRTSLQKPNLSEGTTGVDAKPTASTVSSISATNDNCPQGLKNGRNLNHVNATFLIRPYAYDENVFENEENGTDITWEWALRDSEGHEILKGSSTDNPDECVETACEIDAAFEKECFSLTYSGTNGTQFDVSTTWQEDFTVDGAESIRGLLIGQRCMEDMCEKWKPSLNPFDQKTDRGYDIMQKLAEISGPDVFTSKGSPQYRAACWVLYEDPLRYMATDISLVQRYVLRILIESTDPSERVHWSKAKIDEYSKESECKWNWEHDFDIVGFECDNNGKNIESIEHWGSKMSGSIPTEISQLSHLTHLDMSINKINGTIPDELYNLINLRAIWLDANNLTGTLSSKIGNLNLLQAFGVNNNLLNGTIPAELFNLQDLIELYLFENRFEGALPANMCNGNSIQYLAVQFNSINGTIPIEIGNCKSLVELTLNRNVLTGTVPLTIKNLESVQLLDLSNNSLIGVIPAEIGDMTSLTQLDLSENLFDGTIPEGIGSLEDLAFLRLEKNRLEGDVPQSLCKNFEQRQSETYLSSDCDRNADPRVSCPCCDRCFGPFESNERQGVCPSTEIKISTFRQGGFYDPWIINQWTILDGLGHTLVQEGLSHADRDCVESGGCVVTHKACVSSKGCYTLHISRPINFISFLYLDSEYGNLDVSILVDGEGEETFVKDENQREEEFSIGYCKNTMLCGIEHSTNAPERTIFDQFVKVSGESCFEEDTQEHQAACWIINEDKSKVSTDADPEMKEYLLHQRYIVALLYHKFDLTSNLNTSAHECDWYGMHCNDNDKVISKIDLSGNNLDGQLFRELGELKFLKILNLERNKLGGEIPLEMANIWGLEELYLGDNSFSGSIATSFGVMSNMKVLDLHKNSISGNISSELYNLANLKVLNMTRNLLGGTISPNIGKLVSLEKLDLSLNFFTGVMPVDIFSASNLTKLNLQSNEMTGKIPIPNEQSHSSLTQLVLNDNKFGSSMPTTINKLIGLKQLMLDNNKLTGIIPTQLGNLTQLEKISLSYNELKNTIPTELRKLKNLQEFYLHGNKLFGNADVFSISPKVYIADCGFPSVTEELILCNGCTVCCNALEQCQENKQDIEGISPLTFALILLSAICAFFILFSVCASHVFKSVIPISSLSSLELCGASSVYHFILCKSLVGWTIVLATLTMQFLLFTLFLRTSSFSDKTNSDWVYGMRCPKNRDCEDYNDTTWLGWLSFVVVLVAFSMKDIVKGVKLIFKATIMVDLRCFIAGMLLISITVYGMLASYFYNKAIALSDTEIIVNSLILLFMTEMDEWTHYLIFILKPKWTTKRLEEAQRADVDKSSPEDEANETKVLCENSDSFEDNRENSEEE